MNWNYIVQNIVWEKFLWKLLNVILFSNQLVKLNLRIANDKYCINYIWIRFNESKILQTKCKMSANTTTTKYLMQSNHRTEYIFNWKSSG